MRLFLNLSCGGNILINVGPNKEGRIVPIFEERLRQVGSWLSVNGEAIYGSRIWKYQNDTTNPDVWYTQKSNSVYAIMVAEPKVGQKEVALGAPQVTASTMVSLLGFPGQLQWIQGASGLTIDISEINFATLPAHWAYAFKLDNVS